MDFSKAILAKYKVEVDDCEKQIETCLNDPEWMRLNNKYNRDGFVSKNIAVTFKFVLKCDAAVVISLEIKRRFIEKGWTVITDAKTDMFRIVLGK